MKILVTGLTGFTGQFFQTAATLAGHEVVGLQADLLDKSAVTAEVRAQRPDAVVHLAAISFVQHPDLSAIYAVNVVGTTHLLDALATFEQPLRKVILASSANVYGNCRVSPIQETQATAPVNHYAMSKLAMEIMARNYLTHLPIVVTRPFNYVGPGQGPQFLIPKLVDHFHRRASDVELGNIHVAREFNDVRMVCEAYLALIEHGEPGEIYNLCSGQAYTLRQVIDTLSELTRHHINIQINPAFVRSNEVDLLCGDPTKLQALLVAKGIVLPDFSLSQTLSFMLDQPS